MTERDSENNYVIRINPRGVRIAVYLFVFALIVAGMHFFGVVVNLPVFSLFAGFIGLFGTVVICSLAVAEIIRSIIKD